jgi:hypothetical protein
MFEANVIPMMAVLQFLFFALSPLVAVVVAFYGAHGAGFYVFSRAKSRAKLVPSLVSMSPICKTSVRGPTLIRRRHHEHLDKQLVDFPVCTRDCDCVLS